MNGKKKFKPILLLFVIIFLICLSLVIYHIIGFKEKIYSTDEFDAKLESTVTKLLVEDVNASVDFYEKYFGFKPYKKFPIEGEATLAVMEFRKLYVMLQDKKIFYEEKPVYIGGDISPSYSLYIDVDDALSIYEKVKEELEIVQDYQQMFYGRYELSVKDLDGHIITFSGSR